MKARICIFLMLITLIFIFNAVAHVPISGGDNNTLETAIKVNEPEKSWAIYDDIHEPGKAIYYKVQMKNGQRLKISLFTPKEGFTPGIVVMGADLTSQGTLPSEVEVPDGYYAMVFEGEKPNKKEYEPFTPASYYFTADVDTNIDSAGTYYIAVFDESNYGKVGIAIGFIETFSIAEWLLIPVDTINIHLWEGQNIALILAPLYLTIIIGIIILFYRIKKEHKLQLSIYSMIVMFAALLFIGSGLMIVMQMINALAISSSGSSAIITLIFAILPIILGIFLVRASIKITKELKNKERAILLILGILGLVFWSGLIIGPILAIIVSFLPIKN
ncbi:MAG: hypothetical protein JSU91_03870 [Thermoplasmatales archaeon]|nr:MAG: hypothetical protein JSU91_03870 [Thermoplasmatales archaeon]